jgi:hypothetical protein
VTERIATNDAFFGAELHQRIEPMHGTQQDNCPVYKNVASLEVGEFVKKDQAQLAFVQPLEHFGRDEQSRATDAEQRGRTEGVCREHIDFAADVKGVFAFIQDGADSRPSTGLRPRNWRARFKFWRRASASNAMQPVSQVVGRWPKSPDRDSHGAVRAALNKASNERSS